MVKHSDFLVEGSDYLLSLSKLQGKKIKDITGFVILEFDEPVFEITDIILDDDTKICIDAEHDCAYLYMHENEDWDKLLVQIHNSDPDTDPDDIIDEEDDE